MYPLSRPFQIFVLSPELLKQIVYKQVIDYFKLMFIFREHQCLRILFAAVTVLDLFLLDQVPMRKYNVCTEVRVRKKETVRHMSMTWLECE